MSPRSHESWKEQLPGYLLGALSPGEKTDLEHHLGGCPECQSELRWLEPATERLANEVDQIKPSPRLKSRVMAAVAADLAENPVPEEAEAHAPVAEPARKAVRKPRRAWLDFGQLMRPIALGAMAAVLFAGVVIGYAVGGDEGSSGTGDGPVVANTHTIPSHSNVGDADAVMVTSGNSGTLKVTNLPKLHDGEVYQAWVQKGQSVTPTDSLFTPRRNGTATTSIPDLSNVNTVMVSAEPKGGSEQPTTPPIITIEIPA
ncbi:MAG: anti-sigma factor [Solirubrobacterales bacterium]|nr:anti-sigma factor [Solirubrobacterales bacterium]